MASLIVTVLNEEQTILELLDAVLSQTVQPTEMIVVDGGSLDPTCKKISQWAQQHPEFPLQLLHKTGNRSVGRNVGFEKASSSLIAITDAGCIPEKQWLENLLAKQHQTQADVVAGFYRGIPSSSFSQAVIPYFLVMLDKVESKKIFLPATRSMLITKSVWMKVGGFDEALRWNEDYVFAHSLKNSGARFAFEPSAVVGWHAPSDFQTFAKTLFLFAFGDSRAGIIRPKVFFLFARYFFGIILLWWFSYAQSLALLLFIFLGLLAYGLWSILKNKKYVGNSWKLLPLLQLTADMMVLVGTICGGFARVLALLFADSRLN